MPEQRMEEYVSVKTSFLKLCRHNVKNYSLTLGSIIFFYSMFWSNLSLSITSLEKRYSLSSSESGLFASAAEIGRLPALLLVSHFGNKFRVPRLCAVFFVCVSISHFIMILPHFLVEPSKLEISNQTTQLCIIQNNETTVETSRQSSQTTAYAIIFFAFVLMGITVSPMTNLAISYIDDNSEGTSSYIYLSIIALSWVIGPMTGFFLGAYFLSLYVDLSETIFTELDPEWVGAWWLLILVIGIAELLISPWLACFPKHISSFVDKEVEIKDLGQQLESVNSSSKEVLTIDNKETEVKYSLKSLPRSVWEVIKNPIFTTIALGRATRDLVWFGILLFLPKYIEVQFSVTPSMASVYSGITAFASGAGILTIGPVLRWLQLTYENTVKLIVFIDILATVLCALLMTIGCDNFNIVGIEHFNTETLELPVCSQNCSCNLEVFHPVCDVELNATYFSPCHAGCSTFNTDPVLLKDTGHCSCTSSIKSGYCSKCEVYKLALFLTVFCLHSLCTSSLDVPIMSTVMRSVSKKNKALSMGLFVLFLSLTAWMPCSVLYGKVIDSTCIVWQVDALGTQGSCWVYDLTQIRFSLMGLSVGIYSISVFFYAVSWYFVRKIEFTWESTEE